MHATVHTGSSEVGAEEVPTSSNPLLTKSLMAKTIGPDGRITRTRSTRLKDLIGSGTTIIVGLSTEWLHDAAAGLDIPPSKEGLNPAHDLAQMLNACTTSHNARMVLLVDSTYDTSLLAKICERQSRPFVAHGLTDTEPTVFILDPDDQTLDREYLHFCSGDGLLNNEVAVFHDGQLVTTTMRNGKRAHNYGRAIQRMDQRIPRTTMVN
jgi:hypothetical protein